MRVHDVLELNCTAAQCIFDHAGLKRDGEFTVGDFAKVDRGITEMNRAHLDTAARNWKDYVTPPQSLTGEHFRSVTVRVDDEGERAPGDNYGYPISTVEETRQERYTGMSDELNRQIVEQFRRRLHAESSSGYTALSTANIEQFIGEEVAKFVK